MRRILRLLTAWIAATASGQTITDVHLHNESPFDAAMVTIAFQAMEHTPAFPSPIRIEPGQELIVENVVESLFGLTTDTHGHLTLLGPPSVIGAWKRGRGDWRPIAMSAGTNVENGGVRRRAARSVPVEPLTRVRVGDTATFAGSHNVSGTATIVAPNLIRVTAMRHDGTAPGLDFRIGLNEVSRRTFTVLLITNRTPFSNATIDLVLPEGLNLDSFDTFTVWCREFDTIIAENTFRAP